MLSPQTKCMNKQEVTSYAYGMSLFIIWQYSLYTESVIVDAESCSNYTSLYIIVGFSQYPTFSCRYDLVAVVIHCGSGPNRFFLISIWKPLYLFIFKAQPLYLYLSNSISLSLSGNPYLIIFIFICQPPYLLKRLQSENLYLF